MTSFYLWIFDKRKVTVKLWVYPLLALVVFIWHKLCPWREIKAHGNIADSKRFIDVICGLKTTTRSLCCYTVQLVRIPYQGTIRNKASCCRGTKHPFTRSLWPLCCNGIIVPWASRYPIFWHLRVCFGCPFGPLETILVSRLICRDSCARWCFRYIANGSGRGVLLLTVGLGVVLVLELYIPYKT